MAMSEMNDTVRKMKNIEQKGQENIILLLHQLKELTAKVRCFGQCGALWRQLL